MLMTYDRYMREHRIKALAARLQREQPRDERDVVPGAIVGLIAIRAAQRERQAVKDSLRGMEGLA